MRGMRALAGIMLALMMGFANPAHSGLPGAIMNEKGFSEQAQNAADAAFNAVNALATKGETVRGASGPLTEIALNSGSLICNSWILMVKLKVQEASVRASSLYGEDAAALDNAIQRLNELAAIIERECTKQKLIGIDPGAGDGIQVGGGGDPVEEDGETPPDTGYHPRPGETIADEICRRKCAQLEAAMNRAEYEAARDARTASQRRQQANDLQRALESARNTLRDARARLAEMQRNGPPRITNPRDNAQVDAATRHNTTYNNLQRMVPDLEAQIRRLEPQAQQAQRDADNWSRWARESEAKAEAARQAFYACLRKCKKTAEGAGEKTHIVIPPNYQEAAQPETGGGGKSVSIDTSKPRVKLESAVVRSGNNPFDSKQVQGTAHIKDGGVKDYAPPAVVQAMPGTVTQVQPVPVPSVAQPVVSSPPAQPAAEVSPPEKPALPPLVVTVNGSFSFAHTVYESPCPQPAGSATIASNHPGHGLEISGVSVTGSIAPKLTAKASGTTVTASFNCSSPANGSFSGTVTGTVKDKVTGETQPFSIPASGTVKGG